MPGMNASGLRTCESMASISRSFRTSILKPHSYCETTDGITGRPDTEPTERSERDSTPWSSRTVKDGSASYRFVRAMPERLQPMPQAKKRSRREVENPEWTAGDFARARPAPEVIPDIVALARRGRGPQKRPTKRLVSLRLDPDVIEHFRARGPGWQARINNTLRKAAGLS